MTNLYTYIDHERLYTDPDTGVLRNLAGIDDWRLLTAFESIKVGLRLEELQQKPFKIKNSSDLLKIHHHLFQDVYEWAGKTRTVEISKGSTPFFPVKRFGNAFSYINSLILEYRLMAENNKPDLAHKLAEILDTINFLHPFREGNGRTQREFLRLLALEKGLTLNLNPPDNMDTYNRYMSGTINSDIETLADLILELISVK
jgi:cell filamentation protein